MKRKTPKKTPEGMLTVRGTLTLGHKEINTGLGNAIGRMRCLGDRKTWGEDYKSKEKKKFD